MKYSRPLAQKHPQALNGPNDYGGAQEVAI